MAFSPDKNVYRAMHEGTTALNEMVAAVADWILTEAGLDADSIAQLRPPSPREWEQLASSKETSSKFPHAGALRVKLRLGPEAAIADIMQRARPYALQILPTKIEERKRRQAAMRKALGEDSDD